MKILITSVVDLKSSAPSRLHFFVRYLSKNHRVTVISPKDVWKARQTGGWQNYFGSAFSKISIYHPIDLNIAPVWQEILALFSMRKLLKKIKAEDFDVHLNYNSLIMGYVTSVYLKRFGARTVYDLADHLPAMASQSPQMLFILRPLAGWLSRHFLDKNVQGAAKIIVTCRTLEEKLNLPAVKSEILPNGIDISLFKKFRKGHRGEIKKWRIGYSGVLREWVDFEPVFRAMKILVPKYQFTLEIAGREGDFQKVNRLAKKMGLEERLKFLGAIPYQKIPSFLSKLDIAILPFKENEITKCAFPLKILEYVAAGAPIISTPLPEIKKLLGPSILYANNSMQWVDCLEKMFRRYHYYSDNIQKKFPMILRYDWKILANRLEEILEDCVKIKLR